MPEFFIYLIKANIALTIFYLAYRLGLRKLTFYTLNRLFLLFGLAFSAIYPSLDVQRIFSGHTNLAAGVTHYSPDWYALQKYLQPDAFTLWRLAQYLFWAGVLVMAVRLCLQLLSLLRIHLHTTGGRLNKEKVRLMDDTVNPFSFFNQIYINPSLHREEEIRAIIAHEKMHVKGWHTADILAGEINNIFYWFNPGAWMIKTAIRENLEFITDRKILQSGVDAKTYQYNLLKVGRTPFAIPLANNFNFSRLRERIRMMNKKRSSRYHLLRYLVLLPAIAGIAWMVTSSGGKNRDDNGFLSKAAKFEITKRGQSTPPSDTALPDIAFFPQADPADDEAKQAPADVQQIKDYQQKMAEYQKKKSNISIGSSTSDKITITSGKGSTRIMMPEKALYFLNGKEVNREAVAGIPPGSITSFSVTNGKEAAAVYGEKGQYGVIKIGTSENQKPVPKPKVTFTPPAMVQDTGPVKIRFRRLEKVKDSIPTVKPEVHYTPPKGIKDTAIGHVNNIKSGQSIISTSPAGISVTFHPGKFAEPLKITSKPLFIIDGVPKDSADLKNINPNRIASITVLKGSSATSVYGDKAKDGAVLITTKGNERKPVITRKDKAITIPPRDTTSDKPSK